MSKKLVIELVYRFQFIFIIWIYLCIYTYIYIDNLIEYISILIDNEFSIQELYYSKKNIELLYTNKKLYLEIDIDFFIDYSIQNDFEIQYIKDIYFYYLIVVVFCTIQLEFNYYIKPALYTIEFITHIEYIILIYIYIYIILYLFKQTLLNNIILLDESILYQYNEYNELDLNINFLIKKVTTIIKALFILIIINYIHKLYIRINISIYLELFIIISIITISNANILVVFIINTFFFSEAILISVLKQTLTFNDECNIILNKEVELEDIK